LLFQASDLWLFRLKFVLGRKKGKKKTSSFSLMMLGRLPESGLYWQVDISLEEES
jgi:hypothetical protein